MTPLELRAIAYAVSALVFIAAGVWLGSFHVQAKWNIDKLAQDKAIESQQAAIIDMTRQRDALQLQVGQAHDQIVQNGATLTAGVTSRLQSLETAIRSGPLRGSVVNTSGVQGALAGSSLNPELTTAIGRVNAAIASLSTACIQVDADRTSILSLEPKPPESKK